MFNTVADVTYTATRTPRPITTTTTTALTVTTDAVNSIAGADQSEAMTDVAEKKASGGVTVAVVATLLLIALAVGGIVYHRHQCCTAMLRTIDIRGLFCSVSLKMMTQRGIRTLFDSGGDSCTTRWWWWW